MNPLYRIILLLLVCTTVNAQSYRPMLDSINSWTYTGTLVPVSQQNRISSNSYCSMPLLGTGRYITMGDSVFWGNTYQRLFMDPYNSGSYCHQGYIREDTTLRRVYFVDKILTPERLLYDFMMQPGDSLFVAGGAQFDYFPAGYYKLDSITSYQTISGSVREFHLNLLNANPFPNPLIWLEGIGFPGELIYDISAFNFGTGLFQPCSFPNTTPWYSYEKILTCFEHNQKVYFDSCTYNVAVGNWCFNMTDSCNYYNICGSVHELSSITSVKISPNPVSEDAVLEIEALKSEKIELSMLDMNGRCINYSQKTTLIKGNQKVRLNLPQLKAGIYLVKIEGTTGAAYTKLVKL